MLRRRKRRPPPTFECPNCGADVRAGALACPSCGSDADTGWSEDAEDIWYEDLGGYEDDVDDDASPGARGLHPLIVIAIIVVAILTLVLM